MNDRTYDAPELTVLGEVAELTDGTQSGAPDQADGGASLPPN
jgi:hypothetical protein